MDNNRLSRKQGRTIQGVDNAEVVDDFSSFAGLKAESDPEDAGIARFGRKSFAGAWKPVIDGRVQSIESPSSGSNLSWRRDSSAPPGANMLQQQGSDRPSLSNVSGSSDLKKDEDGNDSDSEEIRRVPELPEKKISSSKSRSHKLVGGSSSSRKRSGATSNDKEGKRLKRLLRNRVSAQQARERKKAYLIELEQKAKDQELRCGELEEKNATLQRENYMLRQIVKNTTVRGDGESQQ